MKRSWKKKASVWTMAAAMTVIGEPDIRGFGDREYSRDVFADTN